MSLQALRSIPVLFRHSDQIARAKLRAETLSREQEYVGDLLGRVQDALLFMGLESFAWTQTTNPREEQLLGCDAAVVFKLGSHVRVGLFEAKRNRKDWDFWHCRPSQEKHEPGASHFFDQIRRQQSVIDDATIWEMFIDFDEVRDRSTCIWHTVAAWYEQLNSQCGQWRSWNSSDVRIVTELQNLITITEELPGSREMNDVAAAIETTLLCGDGHLIGRDGAPIPIAGQKLFGGRDLVLVDGRVTVAGASIDCRSGVAVRDSVGNLDITRGLFANLTPLLQDSVPATARLREWLLEAHHRDEVPRIISEDMSPDHQIAQLGNYAEQIRAVWQREQMESQEALGSVTERFDLDGDIW